MAEVATGHFITQTQYTSVFQQIGIGPSNSTTLKVQYLVFYEKQSRRHSETHTASSDQPSFLSAYNA